MLPNHAPLAIAEQFGTLAALHPGRIDLGLGRAPGTDQRTMLALRRDPASADTFPRDVLELQSYFRPAEPGQAVQAVPGAGLDVPIWLLGSSLFSAQLAAMLGLPFAFASHFAPDAMMDAIDVYRAASSRRRRCAAPRDAGRERVRRRHRRGSRLHRHLRPPPAWLELRQGTPGKLKPPVRSMDGLWSPAAEAQVRRALSASIAGGPDTVRTRPCRASSRRTGADELLVAGQIFDHAARLHSYEIVAEAQAAISMAAAA